VTPTHWVFLHGTPFTSDVWRPIASRFADAENTISVPSLDSRGDSALHAARIITEIPQDANVHVVGHSFGGQVAIDLALLLDHDERLASLGLLCTRATPYPPFTTPAQQLRDGKRPDIDATMERWFTARELQFAPQLVDYARQRLRDVAPDVWADALDSIGHYNRQSELTRVTAPTTLIAAELDTVSSPETMATMAALVPHAQLTLLHGTSHMGPFLRPDATAEVLRNGTARA
jgi:pimeloyl-ACP methyl ester carboxylesterase